MIYINYELLEFLGGQTLKEIIPQQGNVTLLLNIYNQYHSKESIDKIMENVEVFRFNTARDIKFRTMEFDGENFYMDNELETGDKIIGAKEVEIAPESIFRHDIGYILDYMHKPNILPSIVDDLKRKYDFLSQRTADGDDYVDVLHKQSGNLIFTIKESNYEEYQRDKSGKIVYSYGTYQTHNGLECSYYKAYRTHKLDKFHLIPDCTPTDIEYIDIKNLISN